MNDFAKEISWCHGYFVTRDARVFHEVYSYNQVRGTWWKQLKVDRIWTGYVRVRIGSRQCLLHRLVAEAFLDKPEWATEINHIDGNKENNCAENLEWSTRSLNVKHAFATGLMKGSKGSKNKAALLTEDDVVAIKIALKNPYLGINTDLAKKYGTTQEAISAIKRGINWSHVIV